MAHMLHQSCIAFQGHELVDDRVVMINSHAEDTFLEHCRTPPWLFILEISNAVAVAVDIDCLSVERAHIEGDF